MRALNNQIGIAPFEGGKQVTKAPASRGIVTVNPAMGVIPVQVVHGTADIPAGSTVFLRGNASGQAWAKYVHEYEGVQFVLAPLSEVLLVDDGADALVEKLQNDNETVRLRQSEARRPL